MCYCDDLKFNFHSFARDRMLNLPTFRSYSVCYEYAVYANCMGLGFAQPSPSIACNSQLDWPLTSIERAACSREPAEWIMILDKWFFSEHRNSEHTIQIAIKTVA